MTETLEEIEAAAVHAPGTDITRYQAPVLEEYRARFVMAPEEAAALDDQLRKCMRAVLKEDVDFGLIPGMGNKPSLFKPGAEKLLQWFGFGFTNERDEIERDADGNRIGVTYKCTVFKERADGRKTTVSTCDGYAGYDEDKFYVSAEDARAKAEEKERRYARKDKRDPNPSKWENAGEYRAPWNSLLKMAHKRALVGAVIDATAAAGLFTQDLEDMREAAAADSGFTAAAEASIMALPDDIRSELDRWYRAKKWPDPSRWSAEQWCAALQTAGFLTAKRERPQPPTAQPERQQETPHSRTQAATGLDPEDSWAAKVEGLTSKEEASEALGEVLTLVNSQAISADRADQVTTAILARFPQAAPSAGTEDPEARWAQDFRTRLAKAGSEAMLLGMRTELTRAVTGKKVSPETANGLIVALNEHRAKFAKEAA